MDPNLAALLGVVFGGIGAVAGVTAVFYARNANRSGDESKRIAGEANGLAEGSNTIALDARKIALEANEYSHRAEARETERHDVYWDGGWIKNGVVYRLYKRGDNAAHDVVATVTVDGEEQTVKAPLMQQEHGWLDFHFPGVAAQRRREAQEDAAAEKRAARADAERRAWPVPLSLSSIGRPAAQTIRFEDIEERVVWTTDRGTPKLHTDESRGFRN